MKGFKENKLKAPNADQAFVSTCSILYNANRSRWKSFADAWVNLNSLENFRCVFTTLNFKRISVLTPAQLQYVSSVVLKRGRSTCVSLNDTKFQ